MTSMNKAMQFYAFVAPGLEQIAQREIAARLGAERQGRQRGVVFFATDAPPQDLLALGTTEDVFALVARGPVDAGREGLEKAGALVAESPLFEEAVGAHRRARPKRIKRITYRIVAQRRSGQQRYVRQEMRRALQQAVAWRFPSWKHVAEQALLEVWALEAAGELICGVRLSDETMRHRTYKVAHVEASLRPTVARALVMLSEPEDGDVFLDPMCGAGTILIERGLYGRYAQLLGGDIRPDAVAAARTNIGPRYKPIAIREWDVRDLPLGDGSVDRVVCNLPFGKKIGEPQALRPLYEGFAREVARVLKAGGVAVCLTSERALLAEAFGAWPGLYMERVFPVEVLGQQAFCCKLNKRADR